MDERILNAIEANRNLYIGGAAGVGKTFQIKKIKEKYNYFCLTSSTGVSASLIGGITFHKMAGIRLGKESVETHVSMLLSKGRKQVKFIKQLKGIILDECSMLNAEFFEKVDKIFRVIRGCDLPFGGVQIILCGDFYQLPPVEGAYLFESKTWYELKLETILLTEIRRQTDQQFIKYLMKLRKGKMTDEIYNYLKTLIRPADDDMIRLYPLKHQADSHNRKMLAKIQEKEHNYKVKMWCGNDRVSEKDNEHMFEWMSKEMTAPPLLTIKKGCKVLYLRNDSDKKLVNGSEGIVMNIIDGLPLVRFKHCDLLITPYAFEVEDRDKNIYYYQQLPILVCYALSIHKSQGKTLERACINIGVDTFTEHQAYVALSRIISPDGVYIESLDRESFFIDEKVKQFYKYIRRTSKN
jgi:ATP-dependent DNA helicase PIF1